MKKYLIAMCIIACFSAHCFCLPIEELIALDTAKVAAMTQIELQDTKNAIKQELKMLANKAYINNDNSGYLNGNYVYSSSDSLLLKQLHGAAAIVQYRLDETKYDHFNAFDHLGSFHKYAGAFTLSSGIIGLAYTIIMPAVTTNTVYDITTNKNKKNTPWGWWMLASGAASVVAIHLGATELKLGSDLCGYGARVTIPIK